MGYNVFMNLPAKNSVHSKVFVVKPKQADKKILSRKKCPACGEKEDPDGRCRCTNQDAW